MWTIAQHLCFCNNIEGDSTLLTLWFKHNLEAIRFLKMFKNKSVGKSKARFLDIQTKTYRSIVWFLIVQVVVEVEGRINECKFVVEWVESPRSRLAQLLVFINLLDNCGNPTSRSTSSSHYFGPVHDSISLSIDLETILKFGIHLQDSQVTVIFTIYSKK